MDPEPYRSALIPVGGIGNEDLDPDLGGQKIPHKITKVKTFHVLTFKVLVVLFRGLDVSLAAWTSFVEA